MKAIYGNYFLFQLNLPQLSYIILNTWDKLFNEKLNVQWNLLKKWNKKVMIETGIWSVYSPSVCYNEALLYKPIS